MSSYIGTEPGTERVRVWILLSSMVEEGRRTDQYHTEHQKGRDCPCRHVVMSFLKLSTPSELLVLIFRCRN